MNRLQQTRMSQVIRKHRVRAKVTGTSERPRMTVFISNKHISAQIIDDTKQTTLVYVTTAGNKAATGTMREKAAWVGSEIAKKAKAAKITKIAYDRNGRLYHGRIQALADAARESGLEF